MQTLLGRHWHHLPAAEVVELLGTHPDHGLDILEVSHRRAHFGPNRLTPKEGRGAVARFLVQLRNPLVLILIASTVITALLKDAVDAAIIAAVVIANAVISFLQEGKAEKAIRALADTMTAEATVTRGGHVERIASTDLVPGDLVTLQAGDKVPADIRLIRSRDLQTAEAALTGESLPAHKSADVALPVETVLAERATMVFATSLVTYGQATGVVVATGDATEVGRISSLLAQAADMETPLTRRIARFSHIVLIAILAVAALLFVAGFLRGQPVVDTLMAAIALAVAMIPEGLPAALTATLAVGVARMAHRKAIIRKLPAVETLGGVTVICSDKTGTLTQNQMTVQKIVLGDGQRYEVTGAGYAPGQIVQDGAPLALGDPTAPGPHRSLRETLVAGALCNDSALREEDGQWVAHGDPTEIALLVSARKAGIDLAALRAELPRLDAIPFDSRHQYMATLHDRGPHQPRIVYVKGAAEALLDRCAGMLAHDGKPQAGECGAWHAMIDELSGSGYRVLLFAQRELPAEQSGIGHDDLAEGLIITGLQAMIDPPRPEAIAAVGACQQAGIRVAMITGDHALTASAIAARLGIGQPGEGSGTLPASLTGKELAGLTDEELVRATGSVSVFARVSPEQKLRLVESLQLQGHIVAMTGDGVNDGPALKQADIGVAMGITGTDVAKEAADIVLTDDNFATIEAAVEEGRAVYDNIKKMITWALPANVGQGFVVMLSVLLGIALPILPIHVLWVNLVGSGVIGIALAFEPKEAGIMRRSPRPATDPLLTRDLLWRILFVGLIIVAAAFGLYEAALSRDLSVTAARTIVVNAIVVTQILYLFNCRSLMSSPLAAGLFANRWAIFGTVAMVGLQILFTHLAPANAVLKTAPIGATEWAMVVGVGIAAHVLVEVEKGMTRAWGARRARVRQAA